MLPLRQTNINPNISAFAYLHGPHDYNAQPFVPIVVEAMIHNKPSRRRTFAQHCSKGFVIGSSPEHYQCWNLWTTSTKATRVSGTFFFKNNYIKNPETTPKDAIKAAANRMTETLRNHTPINMFKDDLEAIRRLETISSRVAETNTNSQIKATTIRTPPRVLPTTPNLDTSKKPTASLQERATQPRVQKTIFTDMPNQPITQTIETSATNTRSRRKGRTLTQEYMLTCMQLRPTGMNARTLASRKFPRHMLNAVLNEDTGELMEYRHLIRNPKYREIWGQAYGNELGRLAQGMEGRVKGTNTIFFISKEDLPAARYDVRTHSFKLSPRK